MTFPRTYASEETRMTPKTARFGAGRRLGLWLVLPVLASWIWATQGGVQDAKLDATDTQVLIQAQYLFQLAKGNDWPAESKAGPFVVAVHGKQALVDMLASKYAAHPIGSQALTVQAVESPEDLAEAQAPQVLYSEASGEELDALLNAAQGRPPLAVTALQPSLVPGATVNLIQVNNQLRYEINVRDAEKRGILVGNRIASWAVQR